MLVDLKSLQQLEVKELEQMLRLIDRGRIEDLRKLIRYNIDAIEKDMEMDEDQDNL